MRENRVKPSEQNNIATRRAQTAQLLAAVSVLAVSLGMSPAYADNCAPGENSSDKPASTSGGTTVNGVAIEPDPVELKTNSATGQYTRRKLPGKMKSGTLTLSNPQGGGQQGSGGGCAPKPPQ